PPLKVDLDESFADDTATRTNEILDKIDEVVYYVNLHKDGGRTLRFVSNKFEQVLGVSREEYIKRPTVILDHCHPEDQPGIFETAKKLREEKRPQTFVYRYHHPVMHRYIWIEEKVYPQFDAEGNHSANLGIMRDVTDRLEKEWKLIESTIALERVLNTIDEVVYHLDLSLPVGERIRFVGSNVEKVFGVSREEFLKDQKNFLSECHPDDLEVIRRIADEQQREKKPKVFHYRYRNRKTGEYRWIEEKIIPGFDSEGNQTDVFGVARDVTVQSNALEKLRVSEERFRMLAENATDIIYRFLFVPQPHYEFISASVEHILGYSPEEYYSDFNTGERSIHPDDLPKMRHATELMLQNSSKVFSPESEPLLLKNIRKDGQVVWIETRNRPILDEFGKVIGLEGISRDVTQRQEAENELFNSRESYKGLIDNDPNGIVVSGFDQKIIFANKAAVEISGQDSEEKLIGHTLLEFLSPAQRLVSAERIKEIASGRNVPFEVIEILHPDGKIIKCESKPVIYNYLGRQSILVFLRNITAERQLEKEQLRLQVAEETNRRLESEIEERKRTEKELFETQKYLRLLIDSSLDMICASDNEGRIMEFNKAAQEAFGYTREEILGKKVTSLYSDPDQRHGVMKILVEGNGFFSGEVENKRKNGEIFTAFLSASALRDMNGNVIGSMGVSRDITKSKQAENELRLSEEKYRAIYSQAYIGIALIDTDSDKFLDVNQRLCDMLGYSPEELTGKTVFDLRIPGDLSRLPAGSEFIRRGFERIIDEHRYRHKNGSEVIVNVTISLVRGENRKPLYFIYVYEDLTPKRRAEEQIRLQAAKLEAIIESSSHMIWTVDRNFRLTSFNDNQARWLKRNYNATAYIGMPMTSGKMVSEENYNNFWIERLQETLEGKPQNFEVNFVTPSGENTWREIFLNPIVDENETVVEVSCIANDITDKKRADDNLRLSLKEKEVLLKEVHHRVKNNLQVISSILNLQSSYVRDKKILEILVESQNRIKSMAFVHESLYQTKDFSNISFQEYVSNIARNLVHSYSSSDSPPELNLQLDPVKLHLDTAIPCGLIINELLSNALKYAFQPGKSGEINLVLRQRKDRIELSISDNGKGLPDDFDFRNTESLGLQLVVSLVEQINGKIKLDTKKGTKFTIEFAGLSGNA
ncbi:MAG TPA: PAS domain S-box protein, partial [Bacteroidia bacterium]|nr:PAS domain S-box protein [Bacteroidia bacterium]